MSPLARSILKTISYSDIFDYPLTEEEVWKWLIQFKINPPTGGEKLRINELLQKNIDYKAGYYFLKGREELVDLRKKRKEYSQKKITIAHKAAKLLSLISTIQLIGVSGSLAWENAAEYDDIDFFIITSPGHIWTTRFLATSLLDTLNMRRKPESSDISDKICLNMYIDNDHMQTPPQKQNIYVAHEIASLQVLYDRHTMHQQFISANTWIHTLLPNLTYPFGFTHTNRMQSKSTDGIPERFFRSIQLRYMQKRRTREQTDQGIITFHPEDMTEDVLHEYALRVD